jgi:hypothetical protein
MLRRIRKNILCNFSQSAKYQTNPEKVELDANNASVVGSRTTAIPEKPPTKVRL